MSLKLTSKVLLEKDVIYWSHLVWSMHISQIRYHFCWYKQKLKSGKVTSFFFFKSYKSSYLWKNIFISRYNRIIFIYNYWSANSDWLILFLSSKAMGGDSFDFKMLLTIFSLQEQSFLTSALLIFKKIVKFSTLFCWRKWITVTVNFTNKKLIS